MKDAATKPRAGLFPRIARLLALFFLFGFMITTAQLIVLGYTQRNHPGEIPIDPVHLRLSGAGAAVNLLLAIVLFRMSRKAR
jgi:hypothetical protein